MDDTNKNKHTFLSYIFAGLLAIGLALPLAVATQSGAQGMFDECFGNTCASNPRIAELD